MQNNNWTEEGWELLETLALNAFTKTGDPESARKVLKAAIKLTQQAESFPNSGQLFTNSYGEERFKSVFHSGKVAVWKLEDNKPVFVGAWYSLPSPFPW